MARLTDDARRQVDRLDEHFAARGRDRASELLTEAVAAALRAAENPRTRWLSAPRPYPELTRLGYRWIKVHRYWIGYVVEDDGEGVIGCVEFEQADFARRITPQTRKRDD